MKKNLSVLIIGILFVIGGSSFIPQKAYAILGAGDIVFDIPAESKEIIVDTMTTTFTQRIFKKMVNDAVNWGLGGFDGDPSFVQNWDLFLKDSAHEMIGGALKSAVNVANQSTINSQRKLDKENTIAYEKCMAKVGVKYNAYLQGGLQMNAAIKKEYEQAKANCEQSRSSGVNASDVVATLAQNNYELFQSGNLNSRNVARIIAKEGSKTLGVDELTQIIEGKGSTLQKVLGPNVSVNDFKNELGKGGWAAYGALSDLHNTPAGIDALVSQALSKKTAAKVDSVIQNLQTPEKFLDKKECHGGRDEDGNCLGRETTLTPGAQVGNLISSSKEADFDQTKLGKELSDVLARAAGRLTDGLLQKGLAKLSKSGSSSSSVATQAEKSALQFNGTYQSDYDVLGIEDNDGFVFAKNPVTKGGEGVNVDAKNADISVGTIGSDGSAPYIGGPEDFKGLAWNEGPEYKVDLREKIEPAIDVAEREINNYIDMQVILRSSQDVISNLDRCLPGPDFNWEKRFQDTFDLSDEKNNIALTEMKDLVIDSKANIPGAGNMNSLIKSMLGDSSDQMSFNDNLIKNKRSMLGVLESVKEGVTTSFEPIRQKVNPLLPLFISEWDALSKQEKLALAKMPEMKILLKSEEGETLESLLQTNPKRIRESVISYAWDLWRTEMGKTKEGRQRKSELRYEYFVNSNNFATQAQALESESKLKQTQNQRAQAENLLKDCHTLRSYALGIEVSELKKHSSQFGKLKSFYSDYSSAAMLINPYAGAISLAQGLFGSAGNIQYIDTSKARSDEQILAFLRAEYEKKKKGKESLFKTNYFISPSAIKNSILGFASEEAKEKYFKGLYNDHRDDEDDDLLPNALSVVDILVRDKMFVNYRKQSGLRGTLFCRVPGGMEVNRGGGLNKAKKSKKISHCYRDWYIASRLDYKAALAGL